jgi:hypothetical protein
MAVNVLSWLWGVPNELLDSLTEEWVRGFAELTAKRTGMGLRKSIQHTTDTQQTTTSWITAGSLLQTVDWPSVGPTKRGSKQRVDLNYRPLGYECHHQQNLKTMRGAKSNALFLRRANCNRACPCVALISGESLSGFSVAF